MKLVLALLVGATALIHFSCSLDLRPTVRVRLDVPQKGGRPTSIGDFNTYLVLFRGNVANSLSTATSGTRSLSCLGWTGYATGGTFAEVQSGIAATLSQGTYDIQFFGIKGTGTTLTEIMNAANPQVYALTASTSIDTSSNETKSLAVTYSGSTPDLAAACPPSAYNLTLLQAYEGPSGQLNVVNLAYETASLAPRDYTGRPKPIVPDLTSYLFTEPLGNDLGAHPAVDFILQYVNGSAFVDFEVTLAGSHGHAPYGGTCDSPVPALSNNMHVAIWVQYTASWAELNVTPTADGLTATLTGAYRSYYNLSNRFIFSLRSPEVAAADCAYIKIDAISFRAVPVGI